MWLRAYLSFSNAEQFPTALYFRCLPIFYIFMDCVVKNVMTWRKMQLPRIYTLDVIVALKDCFNFYWKTLAAFRPVLFFTNFSLIPNRVEKCLSPKSWTMFTKPLLGRTDVHIFNAIFRRNFWHNSIPIFALLMFLFRDFPDLRQYFAIQ